MKPKTVILMVVAVSCGLGASYMTSRLLADRQTSDERVTILVAAKNLNLGEIIKAPLESYLEERQVAKEDAPRGAFTDADKEKLKGRQLKHALRVGDFVTPGDLHDENSRKDGIVYDLPAGHVAIGIRVNPESIAGGFASLPHSRVNIIWTVRRGDKDSFSKTLLENVLVLAADMTTTRNENNAAVLASVVTVALKQEDAMKLTLAKNVGTVDLVLRRFDDATRPEGDRVTVNGLLNALAGGDPTVEIPQGASGTPATAVPYVPKEGTPVAVDKNGVRHTITVFNGEAQSTADYELDEKTGRVVNQEGRPGQTPGTQPASKEQHTPRNPASAPGN